MNVSTQRILDSYVGRPACSVASLLLRTFERIARRQVPDRPRNVLLIELSEMGSTILASPAIRRLQERNPGAVLHFAILEENAGSLRAMKLFAPANVFTLRSHSLPAMLADCLRFVRFCRRRRIDTTIDLELFTRISSLLSMASGARQRVGFHNYAGEGLKRGNHLTHPVYLNTFQHMSQNFLALVTALEEDTGEIPQPKRAIPIPAEPVKPAVESEAYEYVERELATLFERSPAQRVVVVNHDAGGLLPLRTWPRERFTELVRKLLHWREDVVVVLMGIPEAMRGARSIQESVGDPRCVNFVGRTRSVEDVVQLFRQADLLVTNDSGPAHFATLTDIGIVTLFGPETPSLYGPLGEGRVHLYKRLACSPCFTAANQRSSPCTNNVCLQEISVDEVFAAARRLLEERRPRRSAKAISPSPGR